MMCYSHTAREVHVLDANNPDAQPRLIQERTPGIEYSVSHHVNDEGSERFFILTNWEAQNFRIMQAPVEAPGREIGER